MYILKIFSILYSCLYTLQVIKGENVCCNTFYTKLQCKKGRTSHHGVFFARQDMDGCI